MKVKALNTMRHKLTDAQVRELKENFGVEEIVAVGDRNPQLAKELINTPGDAQALLALVNDLLDIAQHFDFVLLPCGSPKFAWLLAKEWDIKAGPLFAHSVSNSQEVHVEKEFFEPVEGQEGAFRRVVKTVVEKKLVFDHQFFF
jgi:hypothetical protein